ncbi:MAG TPA: acetate--CoA ligase family protein [Ramlibacter sp.]|nr:acetate--CoA ligase family protein [Ramlibacter sp.]
MKQVARDALEIRGTPDSTPGFRHGMRHSSVAVVLAIHASAGWLSSTASLQKRLADALPIKRDRKEKTPRLSGGADAQALAALVLYWTWRVQVAADWPLFEPGIVLPAASEHADVTLLVASPDSGHTGTLAALHWVVEAFNASQDETRQEKCLAKLPRFLKTLTGLLSLPSNTPRLLGAAYGLSMPVALLEGTVYRVGQGRWARWLNSSLTDETPQISAALARDKIQCASIMRKGGMPAPQHELAAGPDEAVAIAQRMGYPVVVKPSDLDGGVGVSAGLQTDDEVRAAFEQARRKSKSILVEKHFEGRDYRLTVFHGEMIWAIERVPAGVTGDGRLTVRDLVTQLNADPRRGAGQNAPLKTLVIDDEALALLGRAGLSADSVVAAGRFVALRRASNVAIGGTPVGVTNQVHPDNSELAVRAAAALKLDVAGVDLLIPDISRSWLETGALVCEVNSGPTLGQTTTLHLYAPIMKALVNGDGRIPIAVVVGAPQPEKFGAAVVRHLAARGRVAGWAGGEKAMVGNSTLAAGSFGPMRGGRMLMLDNRVEAAVLLLNDKRVLRSGLPFERFDVLLVAGEAQAQQADMGELLAALAPACDGTLAARPGLSVGKPFIEVGPTGVARWLAEILHAADESHRGPKIQSFSGAQPQAKNTA